MSIAFLQVSDDAKSKQLARLTSANQQKLGKCVSLRKKPAFTKSLFMDWAKTCDLSIHNPLQAHKRCTISFSAWCVSKSSADPLHRVVPVLSLTHMSGRRHNGKHQIYSVYTDERARYPTCVCVLWRGWDASWFADSGLLYYAAAEKSARLVVQNYTYSSWSLSSLSLSDHIITHHHCLAKVSLSINSIRLFHSANSFPRAYWHGACQLLLE